MTIGGLTVGVTPLDMAHSYETLAHQGERVSGTMASPGEPVGIQEVLDGAHTLPDGSHHDVNHVKTKRVLPAGIAQTETSMLETVLQYGTGRAAAIGQFAAGKTGTTSNYGDAWFVGWDSKYTVAVWVGYPDKLIPMTTDFNNGPVLGGTFPALIWHDFMVAALQIDKDRAEAVASGKKANDKSKGEEGTSTEAQTEGASVQGEEIKPAGKSAPPAAGRENNTSPADEAEHGASPSSPAHQEAPKAPAPAPATPESGTPGAPSPTGGVSPGR